MPSRNTITTISATTTWLVKSKQLAQRLNTFINIFLSFSLARSLDLMITKYSAKLQVVTVGSTPEQPSFLFLPLLDGYTRDRQEIGYSSIGWNVSSSYFCLSRDHELYALLTRYTGHPIDKYLFILLLSNKSLNRLFLSNLALLCELYTNGVLSSNNET